MYEKDKDEDPYHYRDKSNDPVIHPPLDAGYGNGWSVPPLPEPPPYIPEPWPEPKERTDLVFAKTRVDNWGCTNVGTTIEPCDNFGNVMIAGAMPLAPASEAVGLALGADTALGYMAGEGVVQKGMTLLLRAAVGAAGPAGLLILGMLPTRLGDGTLSDKQLRKLSQAPTRVRFQFRQDAEGAVQVYGIHTGPDGDDSVRVVQVEWNEAQTAMEAELGGITLLWTPRHGRLGHIPPQVYPDKSGAHLGTILVHPIPENTLLFSCTST